MNVWQELGIAPTAEVREIRRAYAQRLRHTHPEDDPEGFQRLRAAYESAMAAAAEREGYGRDHLRCLARLLEPYLSVK